MIMCVSAVTVVPCALYAEHPGCSPEELVPEVAGDTVSLEKIIGAPAVMDTATLFEKFKKSKFVRDFPTLYVDTTTFDNGTFVFRALLMKKFWRRLKWLTSRERPVKQLPDSAVAKADSVVAEERPMVRFVNRED